MKDYVFVAFDHHNPISECAFMDHFLSKNIFFNRISLPGVFWIIQNKYKWNETTSLKIIFVMSDGKT